MRARRLVIGVAAGALIALAATSGVSAYWQAQQTIDTATVSSGDLSISADWVGGTPAWPALYPGQSTPDTIVRVTAAAAGDTLVWRLKVAGTTAPDFTDYVTFQAWIGTCGSSAPIPTEGTGSFTAETSTIDVCVRYTLNAGAPSSLQGRPLSPQLIITAEQVDGS